MKFKIENIGLILKADLLLEGITLIAAENDSGKSTIGKALFSLIETSNTFEKEYILEMTNRITNSFSRIDNLTEDLEENLSMFQKYLTENIAIQNKIFLTISSKKYLKSLNIEFLDNIKKVISSESNNNLSLNFEKTNNFIQILEEFYKTLNNIKFEKMNPATKENWKIFIEKINTTITELNSIKNLVIKTANYENIKKISFEKALKGEFKTGIKNIFLDEENSSLVLEEKGNTTEIKFKNNKITSAKLSSKEVRNKYNIIYIESPLILDYIDEICDDFQFFFDTDKISENRKVKVLKNNLTDKEHLDIVDEMLGKEETLQKITKKIETIISGEFLFDNETKSYSYKKDNKEINIKNTANGIKTFGIIEMLLRNKKLNENCILIIDEPEVHLHPNWQVKYAEILTLISLKLGVKILLNSHSPYFIEAIKVYSEKYKNNIKFYSLIDTEDKKAKILVDKTNDLGFIYNKLVEAYDIIKQVEYSDV